MIDIKDIRIGIIVKRNAGFSFERTSRGVIEESWNDEDITVDKNNISWIFDNLNYIEPIPLTEEWLFNFGFMSIREGKYGRVYAFYIDDFGYILDRDWHKEESYHVGIEYTDSPFSQDKDNIYNFSHEMRFVHQLQNMYFALTGEELTLKTP